MSQTLAHRLVSYAAELRRCIHHHRAMEAHYLRMGQPHLAAMRVRSRKRALREACDMLRWAREEFATAGDSDRSLDWRAMNEPTQHEYQQAAE